MSEHIVPLKTNIAVWLTLMVLTGVTAGVAFIDLGPFNTVVALVIATCKATLVVLFFMHAYYSTKRTQLIIIAGVFWLAIMLFMTLGDYGSRSWDAH